MESPATPLTLVDVTPIGTWRCEVAGDAIRFRGAYRWGISFDTTYRLADLRDETLAANAAAPLRRTLGWLSVILVAGAVAGLLMHQPGGDASGAYAVAILAAVAVLCGGWNGSVITKRHFMLHNYRGISGVENSARNRAFIAAVLDEVRRAHAAAPHGTTVPGPHPDRPRGTIAIHHVDRGPTAAVIYDVAGGQVRCRGRHHFSPTSDVTIDLRDIRDEVHLASRRAPRFGLLLNLTAIALVVALDGWEFHDRPEVAGVMLLAFLAALGLGLATAIAGQRKVARYYLGKDYTPLFAIRPRPGNETFIRTLEDAIAEAKGRSGRSMDRP